MNTQRPNVIGVPFCAQAWDGMRLISEVQGLSYDAAREVARSANLTGHTGRMMSEKRGVDWCEVWAPGGEHRCGPFAQTVVIRT